MKYAPFVSALPPCESCGQQAWRGSGKTGGTYRLRCGGRTQEEPCGKTVTASRFAKELINILPEAKEEIEELRQYCPKPPSMTKANGSPVKKRQRKIFQLAAFNESSHSDLELEAEGPANDYEKHGNYQKLVETIKSLKEAYETDTAQLKVEILTLKAQVAALQAGQKAKEQREEPRSSAPTMSFAAAIKQVHRHHQKKVSTGEEEAKGWTLVTKARTSPSKTPPQNTNAPPKPKPTPVDKRAERQPAKISVTQPKLTKSARRPVTLTDEAFQRMLKGQPPKPKGLTWVYLEGLAKGALSNARAFLVRLGLLNRWVKHVGYTDRGVLEVLVFAEHASKIREGLEKVQSTVSITQDPQLYPGDRNLLKKLLHRMDRNIKGLHKDAHCTRRELEEVKKAAAKKLAEMDHTDTERMETEEQDGHDTVKAELRSD